ncbi:hypothetical protein LJC64_02250 [Ruminococcaceae bacterium OttesenSCG-928-A11]|nr:hypothetical protein [Ruminococcaceae bacterium OttesenSCG-928-A11]
MLFSILYDTLFLFVFTAVCLAVTFVLAMFPKLFVRVSGVNMKPKYRTAIARATTMWRRVSIVAGLLWGVSIIFVLILK